jgi:hypothetical protein
MTVAGTFARPGRGSTSRSLIRRQGIGECIGARLSILSLLCQAGTAKKNPCRVAQKLLLKLGQPVCYDQAANTSTGNDEG